MTTSKYNDFFVNYANEIAGSSKFDQFVNEMSAICNELESTFGSESTGMLIPKKFLISYQGVLVLAFEGFSKEMIEMKNIISTKTKTLNDENMGSKWPKMTIGCLKDDVILTRNEFLFLNEVIEKATKELLLKKWKPISLNCLSIVRFKCRDLLPSHCIDSINLVSSVSTTFSQGTTESKAYVDERVIKETLDLETYYSKVCLPGNRESHYLKPMSNGKTELTSVFRIGDKKQQHENIQIIHDFQSMIEQTLGKDKYIFFDDSSLHITLRSIVPKIQ
jgi:hypothetical protein